MDIEIEENIFYDEVMNKLQSLENSLYLAKDGTEDKEIINEIFRSLHTVKGVCDLLGFYDIVKLTHKSEDLLDEIRNNKIEFSPSIYFVLMELKGFVSTLVTDALRGREMDHTKRSMFDSFMEDLSTHLSKSILIWENDPACVKFFNEVAKESQFNIIAKESHEEIFQLLNNNNVQIIVYNILFDNEESMELIKQIKLNSKFKKVSVILSVSEVHENLKIIGKEVGATAWIKKPIDKDHFNTLIEKVLNK